MNPCLLAFVPYLLIGRKSVSLGQAPAGFAGVERGRALPGAPPPTRRQRFRPALFWKGGAGGVQKSWVR